MAATASRCVDSPLDRPLDELIGPLFALLCSPPHSLLGSTTLTSSNLHSPRPLFACSRAVVTRDQQSCRDLQRPARLDMLLDTPAASYDMQLRHSWNPEDRSLNIFVKEDDRLTFHR